MPFSLLTIIVIVFSVLLFCTLFGFALIVLENERDLIKQFTQDSFRNKEKNKARIIEIVSRAAANFTEANDTK